MRAEQTCAALADELAECPAPPEASAGGHAAMAALGARSAASSKCSATTGGTVVAEEPLLELLSPAHARMACKSAALQALPMTPVEVPRLLPGVGDAVVVMQDVGEAAVVSEPPCAFSGAPAGAEAEAPPYTIDGKVASPGPRVSSGMRQRF